MVLAEQLRVSQSSLRILLCNFVALCMALACVGASSELTRVTDLQGRVVSRLNANKARVIVLIFAATDCPISNRYVPEIARLERLFSPQHVAFWWVFPNPGDTLAAVKKHGLEFSITTPTLIDSAQELVRMAHAAVTPEAAVFAVEGDGLHEVYHGRIDDRYIAFGKEKPQAAHHDLEDAIYAALAGSSVQVSTGNAIGCSIVPVTSERSK